MLKVCDFQEKINEERNRRWRLRAMNCMVELELFRSLNGNEKRLIKNLVVLKDYAKGDEVFSEDELSEGIFFISRGSLFLYKYSEEGKEIILDIPKAGDALGENSLFQDVRNIFSARAAEDSQCCICYKKDLAVLLSNPGFSLSLIRSLWNRLENYSNAITNIAFNDVKNRVYNLLENLGERYGIPRREGVELDIILTHEEIAALTNASRVMVSNVIGVLKAEGKIENRRRHFFIKK